MDNFFIGHSIFSRHSKFIFRKQQIDNSNQLLNPIPLSLELQSRHHSSINSSQPSLLNQQHDCVENSNSTLNRNAERRGVPLSAVVSSLVNRWSAEFVSQAECGDVESMLFVAAMYLEPEGYGRLQHNQQEGNKWLMRAKQAACQQVQRDGIDVEAVVATVSQMEYYYNKLQAQHDSGKLSASSSHSIISAEHIAAGYEESGEAEIDYSNDIKKKQRMKVAHLSLSGIANKPTTAVTVVSESTGFQTPQSSSCTIQRPFHSDSRIHPNNSSLQHSSFTVTLVAQPNTIVV